jgi:hypothetical protein
MTHLIWQFLGNSDILVSDSGGTVSGYQKLQSCYSEQDIQDQAKWNDEDFSNQSITVSFPLIEKLIHQLENQQKIPKNDLLFAFVLTSQVKWMTARSETGEGWNNVVALDGIWWENILSPWLKQQNINYSFITLDVDPDIRNGAADWEGMAAEVDVLFDNLVKVENQLVYFQPQELDKIQIYKIIWQHSSGTPALSSAMYLWGIEQKLAGVNVEFVYISDQEDDCSPHSSDRWQWRLKVPQIRELLSIQDFSGALRLLDEGHPKYQELANSLSYLDKSVSLNLEGQNLEGRDSIIERIGIALWSEKAFRDRSQWMHWYLRIAGAFELALLLLLETQGNNDYQWQGRKLIFRNDKKKGEVARCGISFIVDKLLTQGVLNYKGYNDSLTHFVANSITTEPQSKWDEFKKFYLQHWGLETIPKEQLGFNSLINRLYHSLIGDSIDKLLDLKTQELNNQVTDENHPSQIAIKWLEYIIHLAEFPLKSMLVRKLTAIASQKSYKTSHEP